MSNNGSSKAVAVLQPSGILSTTTAPALLQEFNQCLESKTTCVLINLQNVDFIDSSGLGALLTMHTKLRLAGGKLYFCSLKEQARNLFDISDVDRVFDVFANQKEFYALVVHNN